MKPDFDRATKARIHLAVLNAIEEPNDSEKAFAEICAYAEYPGEVFELARAIDFEIACKTASGGCRLCND